MATRRSSFRFRLPWSQDEPASQPSTRPNASTAPSPATPLAAGSKPAAPATSTINLSTVETPTSNQPPDPTENTTPGIPTSSTQAGIKKINQHPNNTTNSPRPIEPSTTSTSVTPATATTGETQISIQPSNMNSTSANSPARSTSQTTTSNATTSKIAQRPPFRPAGAALSPKNRASRNESQSSSPPQATNKSSPAPQATSKSRISPPPASPSDTATKSRLSQFPSSSRSTPQSPALTPTSSPARKARQVLSTKASQESSDSPSVVKTQMQEENQAATLPTSVPKSLQEISGPSSKSTQVRSPILDKKEQMELQTKKATMSDAVSEAKVSFTDKTMQPSEASILKSTMTGTTEGPSEKSHSSSITGESKMLKESASNIQETKEVVHETRGKDYGAGEKSRQVQSKQAYIVKQEEATKDHSLVNPVSNGRQTRASASQTRNKTIFTGSSQKTVSSEPHIPLHREIKDNISKVFNRVAVGDGKQENGKIPVNVITLAGDNRGASMQLGSDSSTKGGRIHIHRGYKINPDESADATTDGEGSSKRRRSKDARAMEDQTVAAYVNCNAQGINNSISYNSSITERNPGVHMSIPRVPTEPVRSAEKTGLFEAHKAEFSVTPARTIRRRCLRGLFLESSDSDPDKPEKPRRHGCRVGCNDKKKIAR